MVTILNHENSVIDNKLQASAAQCSHNYMDKVFSILVTSGRTRVETGSGHPGHVLARSSGSDPLYKISGSDPDWIMCDINGVWR